MSTVCQEDILRYYIDRKCTRLEQLFGLELNHLWQSVIVCFIRRDQQLQAKAEARPIPSKVARNTSSTAVSFQVPSGRTTASKQTPDNYNVIPPNTGKGTFQGKLLIKVEFLGFDEGEGSDPLTVCSTFLTLRSLSDTVLIATLNSVLKETAKDWWVAVCSNIDSWAQLLSEDYEAEGERQHKRFCVSLSRFMYAVETRIE